MKELNNNLVRSQEHVTGNQKAILEELRAIRKALEDTKTRQS